MPAKATTHLFDLIQSLTKQEKKELHKHAFDTKTNTIYFKVYQLIERSDDYNEELIIKEIGIKKSRFPEIKNYLFKLILKALEIINDGNVSEIKSLQEISQIIILNNKGLWQLALKRIDIAIRKLSNIENYQHVLMLIQLRDEIIFRFFPNNKTDKDVDIAFENFTNNTIHFFELNYYRYMFLKSILPVSIYEKKPYTLAFNNTINNKKIAIPDFPDTFYKKILVLRAECRMEIIKQNYDLAKKMSYSAVKFIKANQEKVSYLPLYLSYGFININMLACLKTGDYRNGITALNKIESILKTTQNKQRNNIDYLFFNINSMSLYSVSGNFEKAIEIGLPFYKKNKTSLTESMEMWTVFNYTMGYSYFALQDFKNTTKHFNQIINQPNVKIVRKDFFLKALFMEIILLFEKKELGLAENKIRNYKHLLKLNHNFDDYEKIMYTFLHTYLLKEGTIDFLKTFKNKYENTILNLGNYNSHLRYFDFISYLTSKIEGRHFVEVVRKANLKKLANLK